MNNIPPVEVRDIIESLSEGVYVCDLDRRITYWNGAAERITGWAAGDVVGSRCFDEILCHIDKDGHKLCGEEYCPLHRAMVTGKSTREPLLVFAEGKDGERIPMLVSVTPIRDPGGRVTGGLETFRDASAMVREMERAKAIQELSLQRDLSDDARVAFTTHYTPHGIIGGDFYAIGRLDEDRYGVMLADVTGHGVSAALYTMHLGQLWDRFHGLLPQPVEFADRMNKELAKIVRGDSSFATAVCGLIDLEKMVFRFAGAGGPDALLARADGVREWLRSPGLPLGVMDDARYDEASADIHRGDSLLLFSDGAVEVRDAGRNLLGAEGLIGILRKQGWPETGLRMGALEEDLLKYSDAIRLDDDLTIIEIRIK